MSRNTALSPLRILHVLRAPVGGLFRHVRDLAMAQAHAGLAVGVVYDSRTGSTATEVALARLGEQIGLGVHRVGMSRNIGWRDLMAYRSVLRLARANNIDIVHGHGAKGGAYARLAGRALKRAGSDVRVYYTAHGGSLHYSRASAHGRLYLDLERRLAPDTDGLIFESEFSARTFAEKVGLVDVAMRVIPNGVGRGEFYETLVADTADDFLFVGELRRLKGVDVLLDALAIVSSRRPVSLAIVGAGPDEALFARQVRRLKLKSSVSFLGMRPARVAFTRGRCLVVPSRGESFPYIVLEAGAASLPMIASNVGGIPEIAGPIRGMLVEPNDHVELAARLDAFLSDPIPFITRAQALQKRIGEHFTIEAMTRQVDDFYGCDLGSQPRL